MVHATITISHDAYDKSRNDHTVDIRQWLLQLFPGSTVIETDADHTTLQLQPMPFASSCMTHVEP